MLENSERLARETEGIGAGVLEDLKRQRETIKRTEEKTKEAEGYLDQSLKTLKGMGRWWGWGG
jgi:vesicle transport through interaction with t-SNAREs protein 1